MTPMQRQMGFQRSLSPDGDFNMWHDYMNLGSVLQRLCARKENHEDTEWARKDAPAAEGSGAWSLVQTSWPGRCRRPGKSGSVSSLSDTSSSGASVEYCGFCRQNGESAKVYRSHNLKSEDGKIACPILRNYTCPTCQATGERAHTRRYCPKRSEDSWMLPGASGSVRLADRAH